MIALIYTLFGSDEEAARVCRTLVEEGVIGCANRLAPARSCFRWEGAVQETVEYPAILKVAPDGRERALARLAELHGYALPAIVAIEGEAGVAFAAFVAGDGQK